jgi:hypothetical protein
MPLRTDRDDPKDDPKAPSGSPAMPANPIPPVSDPKPSDAPKPSGSPHPAAPPDAAPNDGDKQDPPAGGPRAHHPPPPPDAASHDGDTQDAPDDDDGDKPEPRKRTAVVLLPMEDGEPDLLGSRSLDVVGIENDYQDCAKVRVSGTARAISGLRERSAEHFADAWDGR